MTFELSSDREMARDEVILQVARAKREFLRGPGAPAGLTMRSSFFTDVWPLVYGVYCDRLKLMNPPGDGMGLDPRSGGRGRVPWVELDAVRAIVKGYGDTTARELGDLRGEIEAIQRGRAEYAAGLAKELAQIQSRIGALDRMLEGVAFAGYAKRRKAVRKVAKKARARVKA
jgi:hypothetical protein